MKWTVVEELEEKVDDEACGGFRELRPKMPRSHQNPSLKKGPEINGPPGAAAISCRALARWPKLQFGGLGVALSHPLVKHESP